MSVDFQVLRRQFPIFEHKTYINSCAYGALAVGVQEAMEEYVQERRMEGALWGPWIAKYEQVRELMAQLLRVTTGEIAITASASAGMNALASAQVFNSERNTIVISDCEFPTTAQIWHAQQSRGARCVHVPRAADGTISVERFAECINATTALVVITHVCFRNGVMLDIPAIVKIAHAHGAKVLLDCYQSVGALDLDLHALGVDFAAGGMLKYLLGTAGIGFLYVREQLIEDLLHTHTGWFAQAVIEDMAIDRNEPAQTARRFEAGTPPVINCYAAAAGLQVLLSIGTQCIEERIRGLTEHYRMRLNEIGWPAVTAGSAARHGPLVCVAARNGAGLVKVLAEQGIVTSQRDDHLRASFHFYNNLDDVEQLIAALRTKHSAHAA